MNLKQLLKRPLVAVSITWITLLMLMTLALGFSEGFAASSSPEISQNFADALSSWSESRSESIADASQGSTVGGWMTAGIWAVVSAIFVPLFLFAEQIALFVFANQSWLPEGLIKIALEVAPIILVVYAVWISYAPISRLWNRHVRGSEPT